MKLVKIFFEPLGNRLLFVVMILLLPLFSMRCQSLPTTKEETFEQVNENVFSGVPSTQKILTLLFGTYEANGDKSIWESSDRSLATKFGLIESSTLQMQTSIARIDSFRTKQGVLNLYATISTRPSDYDCATCSPVIEVAVFSKKETRWHFLNKSYLLQAGNWGEVPPFEVLKACGDTMSFVFRPGGTLQGSTFESISVFSHIGSQFKEVFYLKDAYRDNSGDCDSISRICWSYNSTLDFITDRTSSSCNIRVVKLGTYFDEKDSVVRNMSDTLLFSYDKSLQRYLEYRD